MTSGQKDKAIDGLDLLNELKEKTNNKIVIMPGSGITIDNFKKFNSFEEIHGSFTKELNTIVTLSKG